ncbi:MAG TPA: energy transducer TonB [candidate division Zixibacteria bacterium]|nr:energy transducer TonB [candidate division Zixibacteria bacterium]MDD4918218.1 energy transducer TonB [candidate division Zixibacteria bacterium]MDM7971598.1 energy transducer TonB [candidate division Zixibacteria bacterium]HOD66441.1 energy transducer TonB [candidate division Zixibacteria bacterium]HOZ07980.1 energy transducer TonB [candidate division Zixibacteria bacterium]
MKSVWLICSCVLLLVAAPLVCTPVGAADEEPADSLSAPTPDDFVAVDRMPEVIHSEQPVYPPEAREKGIEGSLYIRALIDTAGVPSRVKVQKSSGIPALDSSAVDAAGKNRYTPAVYEGKPVSVWISYKVVFALGDKPK